MLVVRILAMLVIVPATYYFVYWVPVSLLPFTEHRGIPELVSFLCAVSVGWFAWRRLGTGPNGPIASAFLGAVVLGAIGFSAGFFGPLILTPEANQGPLLGIFITGPLGFLLGAVAGLAWWLMQGRRQNRQ